MNTQYLRITLAALFLSLLAAPSTQAAQPDGNGKPVPNPDIVYMSGKDSTDALSQSTVRGVELSVDGLSGRDLSLQNSKAGRQSQAIAWSPDGKRAAWFEIGHNCDIDEPLLINSKGPRALDWE